MKIDKKVFKYYPTDPSTTSNKTKVSYHDARTPSPLEGCKESVALFRVVWAMQQNTPDILLSNSGNASQQTKIVVVTGTLEFAYIVHTQMSIFKRHERHNLV